MGYVASQRKRSLSEVESEAGDHSGDDSASTCSEWSASSRPHKQQQQQQRKKRRRRKWKRSEDELLKEVVKRLQRPGSSPEEPRVSWSVVAQEIPSRSAKQCRDRWTSMGVPGLRKREWTVEEDELLLRLHRVHRNSWVRIAKEFEGRNDNMVKSRFRGLQRRIEEERKQQQQQQQQQQLNVAPMAAGPMHMGIFVPGMQMQQRGPPLIMAQAPVKHEATKVPTYTPAPGPVKRLTSTLYMIQRAPMGPPLPKPEAPTGPIQQERHVSAEMPPLPRMSSLPDTTDLAPGQDHELGDWCAELFDEETAQV